MASEETRSESDEVERQGAERPTLAELWEELARLDVRIAQHFKDLGKR